MEKKTTMNIIYLRVSKEDKEAQDPKQQLKAILEKHKLEEYTVIEERGSAYDMDKFHKRKKFIALIRIIFNTEKVTLDDLFMSKYKKTDINLYVWDYHRIMRNFEFSLLFSLLADFFNVKIHSYKEGQISRKPNETPLEKFSRYIFYGINAFSSEDYSHTISTNVKKAISQESGITVSSKGRKWGRQFVDNRGQKVRIAPGAERELNRRILTLDRYYRKQKIQFYYKRIIDKIIKEWGIKISKSYITQLKK